MACLDFAKFKEQVLKYKATVAEWQKTDQPKDDVQIMQVAHEEEAAKYAQLLAEDLNDKALGWRKQLDSNKSKDYSVVMF